MTTTTKKENLSAFLDNESGEFEQRRLLDELQKDDELLQAMSCYTLIGDTIRNEQPKEMVPRSFLAGIHERLEDEPSYDDVYIEQQKEDASHRWLRPVAGFAVAASIATVVALNFSPTISSDQSPITMHSTTNVVSVSSGTQPLFMAKSTMKARLRRYIKSHVKQTPSSAIMPSVRSFTHANN
ncbi:MAG TPA: hypothetical protein ENJ33_06555 [Thiothrix sp.]|nr:hypothetical protein [Thiothrix sp.]